MTSGVDTDLFAVASSPRGVAFAAGAGGVVLRFDGTQWARVESPTSADFYGITATAAGDLFFVGDRGPATGEALRLIFK
jgi:photosystem II stability/assembly factor-like uncharacterized protein